MLIDAEVGVRAPYFHRSWVNLPWGTSEDELRHRLTASYRLVRFSLTKKAQAQGAMASAVSLRGDCSAAERRGLA